MIKKIVNARVTAGHEAATAIEQFVSDVSVLRDDPFVQSIVERLGGLLPTAQHDKLRTLGQTSGPEIDFKTYRTLQALEYTDGPTGEWLLEIAREASDQIERQAV